MTRIWRWNRPVTVREVLNDLKKERSIAYTTVLTVMGNVHSKGWLRRSRRPRLPVQPGLHPRCLLGNADERSLVKER